MLELLQPVRYFQMGTDPNGEELMDLIHGALALLAAAVQLESSST